MKKIILFSRDPGGTNCIAPLVEPLRIKGYAVRVFAKDIALSRYSQRGIKAIDICDFLGAEITEEKIKFFLLKESPDFIITATSADDMTEKYFWKVGKGLKIKSLAILDQWMNYGIRFSEYGVNESFEYEGNNKVHKFLPTNICVMDEYCKQEMINEGFDSKKLIITGQPHFEYLKNKYLNMEIENTAEIIKFRKAIEQNENEITILYASECLSKTYKEGDDDAHYWGFTERTIFK